MLYVAHRLHGRPTSVIKGQLFGNVTRHSGGGLRDVSALAESLQQRHLHDPLMGAPHDAYLC